MPLGRIKHARRTTRECAASATKRHYNKPKVSRTRLRCRDVQCRGLADKRPPHSLGITPGVSAGEKQNKNTTRDHKKHRVWRTKGCESDTSISAEGDKDQHEHGRQHRKGQRRRDCEKCLKAKRADRKAAKRRTNSSSLGTRRTPALPCQSRQRLATPNAASATLATPAAVASFSFPASSAPTSFIRVSFRARMMGRDLLARSRGS